MVTAKQLESAIGRLKAPKSPTKNASSPRLPRKTPTKRYILNAKERVEAIRRMEEMRKTKRRVSPKKSASPNKGV